MNYKLFTHTQKIQIHKHMQTNTDNKAEKHTHTHKPMAEVMPDLPTVPLVTLRMWGQAISASMDTKVIHSTETPVVH